MLSYRYSVKNPYIYHVLYELLKSLKICINASQWECYFDISCFEFHLKIMNMRVYKFVGNIENVNLNGKKKRKKDSTILTLEY